MKKIQVLLPDEILTYLQKMVDDGDVDSISQAVRYILKKEMKRHEKFK